MPYIGLATLAAFVLFYIYPLAGAIVAFLAFFYAAVQCITYSNMFDFLWPKKKAPTSTPFRSLNPAKPTTPLSSARTMTAAGNGLCNTKILKPSYQKSHGAPWERLFWLLAALFSPSSAKSTYLDLHFRRLRQRFTMGCPAASYPVPSGALLPHAVFESRQIRRKPGRYGQPHRHRHQHGSRQVLQRTSGYAP